MQSNLDDKCDSSVLDIKSGGREGITARLSNFTSRQFVFDGIPCASIEGVLQSFRFNDIERQREVCALSGGTAKKEGRTIDWRPAQLLYWQGVEYPRRSEAYQRLLDRLFLAVYIDNETFANDLQETGNRKLIHSVGRTDPSETLLTADEFCSRLTRLRNTGHGTATKLIEDLLREAETKTDYPEFIKVFNNCPKEHKEFMQINNNWYKTGDMYIWVTHRENERFYKTRLPVLTEHGMTISPIYCDSTLGKGFTAIVLQIPNTTSGDLLSFNEAYHLLSEREKNNAYEDVLRLAELGFFNPDSLDAGALRITPDESGHQIVVMNWTKEKICPIYDYQTAKKIICSKAYNLIFENRC